MDVWMEGQNIHYSLRDRRHIHHGSREYGRSGYMPQELAALATAHAKMAPVKEAAVGVLSQCHCEFEAN